MIALWHSQDLAISCLAGKQNMNAAAKKQYLLLWNMQMGQ